MVDVEMLRHARDVGAIDFDQRVAAAVAGASLAIVGLVFFHGTRWQVVRPRNVREGRAFYAKRA
jgi:hypothetical protein